MQLRCVVDQLLSSGHLECVAITVRPRSPSEAVRLAEFARAGHSPPNAADRYNTRAVHSIALHQLTSVGLSVDFRRSNEAHFVGSHVASSTPDVDSICGLMREIRDLADVEHAAPCQQPQPEKQPCPVQKGFRVPRSHRPHKRQRVSFAQVADPRTTCSRASLTAKTEAWMEVCRQVQLR